MKMSSTSWIAINSLALITSVGKKIYDDDSYDFFIFTQFFMLKVDKRLQNLKNSNRDSRNNAYVFRIQCKAVLTFSHFAGFPHILRIILLTKDVSNNLDKIRLGQFLLA
jgi:hypothetical protein